ncbi:MAG: hypothetical protein Q3M24_22985 [Candidatus Electrothrix aestuarii]|uniref:Lipoprotein n=1 Tax=Candidatus Electrothrix aestuarii TaxID=3062594 RepID=A0AAU8LV62_9BACT|nr:hypothetical protein [Candidatus Electrothrix aestuarii]
MRINLLYITIALLPALGSTGCSIAYDMMENSRIKDCDSAYGADRGECLDLATMPYEEYEQERERALEQEQ